VTGRFPDGVVTFVFTDMEGSTRLLQENPEGYGALLERHHDVLAAAMSPEGGCLVRTDGDGSFWAFASPGGALAGTTQAQVLLTGDPSLASRVRVRMGVHTGEAQLVKGCDYVGLAVHHAARISGAAHGGQVVVSQATCLALADVGQVELVDLGDHRLKDIVHPVRLFQASRPGSPKRTFPPLRSLDQGDVVLPQPLTSFHGRGDEVTSVIESLAMPGLVTITGPGGTGKTRLAIEVAKRLAPSLEGTWFVDLQAVSRPEEVPAAAARVLGVSEAGHSDPPTHRVAERIGSRRCLIVLDNCEHVLGDAAGLAEQLLGSCPQLRVLATSRELLGLGHESNRRASPLDEDASLELFAERAAKASPGFTLEGSDRRRAADICRRLDGIPLALELAAARLRHLSLQDLESRLADRFALLIGGRARTTDRHATLQSVIDWSHDLLTDDERVAFRRLAVFNGGFEIAAAAAVLGLDQGPVDPDVVLRLVDRSMVEHDGRGRYRLLETLRVYGQLRLVESGEARAARMAHARHFAAFAREQGWSLNGQCSLDGLELMNREAANLQAGLDYASSTGDDDLALSLVASSATVAALLSRSAHFDAAVCIVESADRSQPRFATAAVQLALAAAAFRKKESQRLVSLAETVVGTSGSDMTQAWAAVARGLICVESGDVAGALSSAERAELSPDCVRLGPLWRAAQMVRGMAETVGGDPRTGQTTLDEAARLSSGESPGIWVATALFWGAIAAMQAGAWAEAAARYSAVLPLFRRVGYQLYSQWVLDHLSQAHLRLNDLPAAQAFAEEGVRLSLDRGLGRETNLARLYEALGLLSALRGDLEQSVEYYRQALSLVPADLDPHDHVALTSSLASATAQLGDRVKSRRLAIEALTAVGGMQAQRHPLGGEAPAPVDNVLQAVARVAFAHGDFEAAAEMAAAAGVHRPRTDSPPALVAFRDAWLEQLRHHLGEAEFTSALSRGEQLEDRLTRAWELLAQLPQYAPSG
jgi:predicted ATPase/class 3 adenylate cyclase